MSCPTVADDMVLVSFSSDGLDNMLKICNIYSREWRFLYNPSKSAVITFNPAILVHDSVIFSLGNDVITINFTYKHLGVECDQHLSTMKSMK
jgi:hypothetical protein